jgi:hypothetical protein
LLRAEFPVGDVIEMPPNNPGFDVRVGTIEDPALYVEVKGTQSSDPVFFLSEGERQFSIRNESRYRLLVVTGIDLKAGKHGDIEAISGEIDISRASLKPTQWRAQIYSHRA